MQQTGYYRVNYDKENWAALSKQLDDDHEAIDSTNRAQILDDSLNLARAGKKILVIQVWSDIYIYIFEYFRKNDYSIIFHNNTLVNNRWKCFNDCYVILITLSYFQVSFPTRRACP